MSHGQIAPLRRLHPMRLRSLLFVACVLAASSAHAAPIFYTFTAVVDRSLLGASNGDIITGGLVFDDHAALVSYAEYPTPPDGLLTWDEPVTDATYDASDFILFFNIGDSFFSTHGAFLNIYNSPMVHGHEVEILGGFRQNSVFVSSLWPSSQIYSTTPHSRARLPFLSRTTRIIMRP
jgi:hypothetical protein